MSVCGVVWWFLVGQPSHGFFTPNVSSLAPRQGFELDKVKFPLDAKRSLYSMLAGLQTVMSTNDEF